MKKVIIIIGFGMGTLLTICLLLLFFWKDKDLWDTHRNQWSPFLNAVYDEDLDEIEKYINKGVDVNEQSQEGYSALEIAIRNEKYNSVKILLENGAKMNLENTESPIIVACMKNNLDIVKLLVEYGADTNEENETGWTPLMSATAHGSKEILIYLIEQGADVNTQRNVDGNTALMLAVYNGDYEKTKILLDAGADPTLKNLNGDTAYDYNKKYNFDHQELYKMIDELLKNF